MLCQLSNLILLLNDKLMTIYEIKITYCSQIQNLIHYICLSNEVSTLE
jgi:hypothetical protein